jgi:hypothetical protein
LVSLGLAGLGLDGADAWAETVSFERSLTNGPSVGTGAGTVDVRLRRFGPSNASPLTVPVEYSSSIAALNGTQSVTIPAGAWAANLSLPIPSLSASNANAVVDVKLLSSSSVQPDGILHHVVRLLPRPAPTSATVQVNAVVFSGAEVPADAILCQSGTVSFLLQGGVVALGGGAGAGVPGWVPPPPSWVPMPFSPDGRYAKGDWIPPLAPTAVALRFGTLQSEAP